jgi:gas vesicle protein
MIDNGSSNVLLAFVAGTAVGAVVALLLAPKSGRELRADIRDLGSRITPIANRVPDAVRSAYDGASAAAVAAFHDAVRTDGSSSPSA